MNIKNIIMLILLTSTLINMPVVAIAGEHKDMGEEPHKDHDQHSDEDNHDQHGNEDEHENHDQNGNEDKDEGEEGVIRLTEKQMKLADIVVESIQMQDIKSVISAPGEVRFNAYKTAAVTSRITAQLIKRHVVLGETVKKGQAIATLSSVEMADAQGNILVSDREWKRVKELGEKIVSERRYTEARVNWELAKAKAYGMTEIQISTLIKNADFSRANGRFVLIASLDGTILKEDYIVGQQIEAGQELNLITDESSLWVMANVTPALASQIKVGNSASVQFNNQSFSGKVSQISHTLDEITRTKIIRLNITNRDDALHPGLFVNTQIETESATKTMALTLPEAAVLRSPDGDWQVLVEQEELGEFKGVEVELLRVINGEAIIEGLSPGTRVVVQGAFFVQSELAKSGFEVHNH